MNRLLLLSGGLDSTAVAALVRPDHCLHIGYGQLATRAEERAARQVAAELSLPFTAVRVDLNVFGSGLMAGRTNRQPPEGSVVSDEWWPYRNQVLITLAAAWGVTRDFHEILVGTVLTDAARHADGTAEFLKRIDELVSLQEGRVRVAAPAAHLTTRALIHQSQVSDRVLAWTHSCHQADLPCGACPGCAKRAEVLRAAGRLR